MALETERKFLLASDGWRGLAEGISLCQGYLVTGQDCGEAGGNAFSVRVRLAGARAWLAVKGRTVGATRLEYEYPIPPEDAREMLDRFAQRPLIEKTRYTIPHAGMLWEVDEFFGDNRGLVIAELELEHEAQAFAKPDWVGEEVTHDPRYYNASLVRRPYTSW